MSSRRGWGEDGIFFEHDAPCRDSERHRHCEGRWRGVVSLGFGPDGKRIRRKVSGKTKAAIQDRLKALHSDLESGVQARPNYTVRRGRRLADRRARRPISQDDRKERAHSRADPGRDRCQEATRADGRGRAPGADSDGPALLKRRRGNGTQRVDSSYTARRGPRSRRTQCRSARRHPERPGRAAEQEP